MDGRKVYQSIIMYKNCFAGHYVIGGESSLFPLNGLGILHDIRAKRGLVFEDFVVSH